MAGQCIHDRALGPAGRLAFVDEAAKRPVELLEVRDLAAHIPTVGKCNGARPLTACAAFVQPEQVPDGL